MKEKSMGNRPLVLALLFLGLIFVIGPADAARKIIKVSGDRQQGIAGYPLEEDFVVQVLSSDGTPQEGVPVIFAVLEQPVQKTPPGKSIEPSLSSSLALTGPDGLARTRLNTGYPAAGTVVVSASTKDTMGNPVAFTAAAHSRHWFPLLIVGMIGGLGLFLFGMFYLNDGLKKSAGNKLRGVLITLTGSHWRGMMSGLSVTLFNQSSSATTLLEVSLVGAGLLTFYQTMAVTMGAEIGSTITAQLVAFNLSDYGVLIAGIGFYISFFAKNKRLKKIGETIVGFGILFLGIKIMSDLLVPLREHRPFIEIMESIENPLLGILAGLFFTMLVHSSGATTGIVIALALAGAITLKQAVPLTLGAQIGTCITALLGSIGRGREGKRVALWHTFHQTAGVLLVYPFLTIIHYRGEPAWFHFVQWFTSTFLHAGDLARQIAMSHTLVAVFNALIFMPLLPLMNRLSYALYPRKEEEKPFGPIYIDEVLLSTPALALEQARKEVVRQGEIVMEMMRQSLEIFDLQNIRLCDTVSLKDIRVDVLHNAIVPYLTKTAQGGLSEQQSHMETRLLYITADLEAIGDIIDKNIVPLARKKLENNLWFSDEGWKDIVDLHTRVTDNLDKALTALRDNNRELMHLVAENKTAVDLYESALRKRHIGRLHSGLQESLETSSVHLDLIDQLKRINSHVAAIGYSLLGLI